MVDAALTGLGGSSPQGTGTAAHAVRPRSGDVSAAAPAGVDAGRQEPGLQESGQQESGQQESSTVDPSSVLVRPTWFGPAERPLFGWWHVPATRTARATVVMASATARERLAADYSWRLLAARLAESGFAVLRFDFSSTGDSAGTGDDPDLLPAWRGDVVTALESARLASEAPLVLVGHRIGATIATAAAREAGIDLDAMILWDPVLRGKRYLRELRAQQMLAVPGDETDAAARDDTQSGWADVPGDDLSTATAAAISRLDLLAGGPLPTRRALVLARTGAGAALLPLIDGLPDGLVEGVTQQAELLNLDPILAVHAYEAVDLAARWADDTLETVRHPVDAPSVPATRLTIDRWGPGRLAAPDGHPDRHEIIERAGFLGDGRIFTVESEPAQGAVGDTVLMLSAGVELHTGPARMWVDLARQWAAYGMRVVRCDMPGLGESPAESGSAPQSVYEAAAIDDVEALIRELDPDDPGRVVLLGMCSGAYNGLEAGARIGTRRQISLAFGWWLVPAELRAGRPLDRRRKQYRSGLAGMRLLMAFRAGRRMFVDHPERLWLMGSASSVAAPMRPFRRAVAAGGEVTMVMGPSDVRHFAPQKRRLRRLCARPGFRLHSIDGLDHGLLSGEPRRIARRQIFDQLLLDPGSPQ